ncbi:MAG: ABC transporter ATP-binding protein [Gammaproteobacteria bacterium]
MTASIQVDNLSKEYRIGRLKHETMLRDVLVNFAKGKFLNREAQSTFWAVKNVSFTIDRGEVVGIIGRNGAGKSTLLKLLSKITYPTTGSINVQGRVASLLEVGTGFHEELTGRENIYLNGSILGMKKHEIDERIDQIIEFSGVEMFIETPIKRYSSGMKLRLGFAVAAHLDPDILQVDEVLAVGDAAFQKKCLQVMDDLRSGGRTVLFVSHNMEAVENLCSRCIWIDQGKIRQDGNASEVIRAYMSSFSSLGSAHMDLNKLESRIGSGEIRLTSMEILTTDGNLKEIIRSGDSLLIRIHYYAKQAVSDPHFGFRLTSQVGTLITDVSTWSMGLDTGRVPQGAGEIDFEIDFLNLMPARYYLTLWIQGVGSIRYDILENFMAFDIEGSDYYNSGRGISSNFGLVFFPCKWTKPRLLP